MIISELLLEYSRLIAYNELPRDLAAEINKLSQSDWLKFDNVPRTSYPYFYRIQQWCHAGELIALQGQHGWIAFFPAPGVSSRSPYHTAAVVQRRGAAAEFKPKIQQELDPITQDQQQELIASWIGPAQHLYSYISTASIQPKFSKRPHTPDSEKQLPRERDFFERTQRIIPSIADDMYRLLRRMQRQGYQAIQPTARHRSMDEWIEYMNKLASGQEIDAWNHVEELFTTGAKSAAKKLGIDIKKPMTNVELRQIVDYAREYVKQRFVKSWIRKPRRNGRVPLK